MVLRYCSLCEKEIYHVKQGVMRSIDGHDSLVHETCYKRYFNILREIKKYQGPTFLSKQYNYGYLLKDEKAIGII